MNTSFAVAVAVMGAVPLTLLGLPTAFAETIEGNLISPFPSTIRDLDIPNAHLVGKNLGTVIRGMSPLNNRMNKTEDLLKFGVTDFIIFKDEVKKDVSKEKHELIQTLGYRAEHIHVIPFRWQGVTSYQEACEQMIDAVQVLETAYNTPGSTAYFHCTVGEDRTGMLAGIFKMIEMKNQGWDTRRAFDEEMCRNGYEAGNPNKPDFVVDIIRRELTPIFLKLATLIDSGVIAAGHLDRSVCDRPVRVNYEVSDFTCRASPLATRLGEISL